MSRFSRFPLYFALFWLPVHAGIILSVDANPLPSVFYNLGPTQALVSSLTTTNSYSDVSFFATLANNFQDEASGTAFLTTAIGPAATLASLIDQAPFTIGPGITNIELLNEASLQPGTYYLVLTGSSGSSEFGWLYTPFPILVAGPGVTEGQRYYADPSFNSFTSFSASFPPGSTFVNLDAPSNRLLLSVIAADVPEPAMAFGVGVALAALIISRVRKI